MKLRTIKLPHFNNAAEMNSTEIRLPEKVIISMSQHGGVPCTPLVSVGDTVKTGQLIGISDAVISAPVHSSVTGKVSEITEIINVFGKRNKAVVIETDLRQTLHEDIKPPVIETKEDFINAVKNSGSVGLGGAGFQGVLAVGGVQAAAALRGKVGAGYCHQADRHAVAVHQLLGQLFVTAPHAVVVNAGAGRTDIHIGQL